MKRILDFGFWILDLVNRKSKIQNLKLERAIHAVLFLALVTGHWSLVTESLSACPLCKDTLFSPGEGQALSQAAHAFNLSIVTLASVPFVLVGGIAWLIVRSSRRMPRNKPRSRATRMSGVES